MKSGCRRANRRARSSCRWRRSGATRSSSRCCRRPSHSAGDRIWPATSPARRRPASCTGAGCCGRELQLGQVLAGELVAGDDLSVRVRTRGQVVAVGPQTLAGRHFDVAVIELFGDVLRGDVATRLDGVLGGRSSQRRADATRPAQRRPRVFATAATGAHRVAVLAVTPHLGFHSSLRAAHGALTVAPHAARHVHTPEGTSMTFVPSRSLRLVLGSAAIALAGAVVSIAAVAAPHRDHGGGADDARPHDRTHARRRERQRRAAHSDPADRAGGRRRPEGAARSRPRALREQSMQLFTQPNVDANAAETLRQQMLQQHDQASKRMLQAMLDASRVLTPEQRARDRRERMKQRREMSQRRIAASAASSTRRGRDGRGRMLGACRTRLLLIDDDARLTPWSATICAAPVSMSTAPARWPQRARSWLVRGAVLDALVLDLMLPDGDGLEFCRELRAAAAHARAAAADADRARRADRPHHRSRARRRRLPPKPFEPRELLARVKALLRRAQPDAADDDVLRFGRLEIDLGATRRRGSTAALRADRPPVRAARRARARAPAACCRATRSWMR